MIIALVARELNRFEVPCFVLQHLFGEREIESALVEVAFDVVRN